MSSNSPPPSPSASANPQSSSVIIASKLSFTLSSSTSSTTRKVPHLQPTRLLNADDNDASTSPSSFRVNDESSAFFSSLTARSSPSPPTYIIPLKENTLRRQSPAAPSPPPSDVISSSSSSPSPSPIPAPSPPAELFSTLSIPLSSSPSLSPPPPSFSVPSYSIPMEQFGVAMLRGMGWRGPGDAIGGINKADVQPVSFKRREDRSGLGAKREAQKGGGEEKKEGGGERKLREESAHAKLKAKAGSRLIPLHSQQLRVDALVSITHGPHRRQYGRVKEMREGKREGKDGEKVCDVLLNVGHKVVEIDTQDLEVLDERALPPDHPAFGREEKRENEERKEDDREESANKRQRRDAYPYKEKEARASDNRRTPSSSSSPPSSSSLLSVFWCRPHLRVRLISRSYAQGRYFRAKGVIIDVADAAHISLRLEEGGKVVEGLREDELETLLPPVGSNVMVLEGEHRGEVAKLIEKDSKRSRVTVQLESELTVLQLNYDDVCEYV